MILSLTCSRYVALLTLSVTTFFGIGPLLAQDFFVSPDGRDTNPGTQNAPFATLTRARDAVRERASQQKPATVYLRAGTYYVSKTIDLTKQDGGTEAAPVVYRAFGEEKAILCGSSPVPPSSVQPVSDPATLDRILPDLRPKIRFIDLKALKISHRNAYPDLFNDEGGIVSLFIDGKRMPLSRYPNKGYMTIKKVIVNGGGQESKNEDWRNFYADGAKAPRPPRPGVFEYRRATNGRDTTGADRPARWMRQVSRGVWLKGYWRIPWQNEAVRVAAIDTAAHTVTLAAPVPGGIGNKYTRPEGNGKEPYWLMNLLEEVDLPGEWAVDFSDQKLYFYPPAQDTQVRLADLSEPLLRLTDVSNVVIQGITFEENLADAIVINGGANNRIAGCTIHNINQYAIRLDGGSNHIVQSSDLFDLGAGGVWLGGGDETTTPRVAAGHQVVNNHIHHFSQITRIYAPAVNAGFTGGGGGGHHPAVGMYVAHNLIHDTPHAGVLFGSWDSRFEYNEIFRMCLVSDDMGGFYSYDQYERMGNHTFAYNFIHNSTEGDGIYFDHDHRDMHIFGNILYLNSSPNKRGTGYLYKRGSQDKHPQTIDCYNNVAINCNYGFQFVTVRGPGNHIENNVAIQSKKPFSYVEMLNGKEVKTDESLASGKNIAYETNPGFADLNRFDFSLKPDAQLLKDLPGFKPIPFDKIGLYVDEYRKKLPSSAEIGRFGQGESADLLGQDILDRN
ncbi:right-handed parallel beta-helix repeat-containing protein (plasmid) [Spirosoma sp. SC4-14]|uniref:right-handed parallel beta-helix repeat-containing protein n=1 Tax=Spirosoma sp. SC4-14 TaxID=3128900 RepID=UPI0030CD1E75